MRYIQEALAIQRELDLRFATANNLNNLGHVHAGLGEDDVAWEYLCEALPELLAIGAIVVVLEALVGVALLQAKAGRYVQAAELLGLVMNHPALDEETKQYADPVLATLREAFPADQLEAALERGKSLDLEAVVAEILEEAAK